MIRIDRLDHFVLTCRDMEATMAFYERVLGMERISFRGGKRWALRFGRQKINLHPVGYRVGGNVADRPTPGSADFCLVAETPMGEVVTHLRRCGVAVETGPDERSGAAGPILSVYFRDPDKNLVEVSTYLPRKS